MGRGSKLFNHLPLLLVHAIGYQHFIDWKDSCMYKCSKYKCFHFFSSKNIGRGGVQNITNMKYVPPPPPHTPHPQPQTHENTKAFSYLIIRPLYLILPFCTRKQILILKVEKLILMKWLGKGANYLEHITQDPFFSSENNGVGGRAQTF